MKTKHHAFCPECGDLDHIGVDPDGLCPSCGATCMGPAVDKLVTVFIRHRKALEAIAERQCTEKPCPGPRSKKTCSHSIARAALKEKP